MKYLITDAGENSEIELVTLAITLHYTVNLSNGE